MHLAVGGVQRRELIGLEQSKSEGAGEDEDHLLPIISEEMAVLYIPQTHNTHKQRGEKKTKLKINLCVIYIPILLSCICGCLFRNLLVKCTSRISMK